MEDSAIQPSPSRIRVVIRQRHSESSRKVAAPRFATARPQSSCGLSSSWNHPLRARNSLVPARVVFRNQGEDQNDRRKLSVTLASFCKGPDVFRNAGIRSRLGGGYRCSINKTAQISGRARSTLKTTHNRTKSALEPFSPPTDLGQILRRRMLEGYLRAGEASVRPLIRMRTAIRLGLGKL